MSVRSYVIQLQAGVGQAILPDHRKMVPGQQYVVDAETFSKISLGARQNVISVVNVNTDSTIASGTFYPAQTSNGVNRQLTGSGQSIFNLLSQTSTTLTSFTLAGFASQGYDPGGIAGTNTGTQYTNSTLSGSAYNQTLIGPDESRYTLAYNGTSSTLNAGWSTVWADYVNRYIGTASGNPLVVKQDGQSVSYVISSNTTLSGVNGPVVTVGTKVGEFAGIPLVNIPVGNFGWIQIEGIHPNAVVASGTAVGATVGVLPAASGALSASGVLAIPANTTFSVTNTVVSGTAQSNNIVGTVLTAPASGTGTGQFFAQVEIRSRRVKKPYVRFLNKN
jgi:hypothetical protein